jgi:aminocarboxymuconate-semialdehyde decarboxylase
LAHLSASPLTLLRHAYVDSLVHGAPELRYLIEILGADRIVLGSDTPFDMGTRDPAALFGATLPDDVRQRILAGHQDLLEAGPGER